MISSFTVGSVFKIIDEASPTLRLILRQVRELNTSLDRARASLTSLGKFAMPAGLTTAVAETGALAKAWSDVAKNAAIAQRAIGSASTTAARTALPAAAAAATGGGGGRHRPGFLGGGGGAHVYGPGVGIPGGSHVRLGGGAGMAAAGIAGYGVYQAMKMADAEWQLIYHSGLKDNDETRAKFRKMLQDSMAETGYGLSDTAKAAIQEIRMFQGTPGGGVAALPEMLTAAGRESRAKGSSLEESMTAFIGLAHMTKQYSPEAIAKLAAPFAFLSTADPRSLSSIVRGAGYAVPMLQSGLEIDPLQALLAGTALARGGATNTKSGTWLREMAVRAMPGTSLMSRMAYAKHEAALKALGLSDEKGKPTWFDDKGKPDLLKMLDIGAARAAAIPLEKRAAYERSLFGAQGSGAFALLANPVVREQIMNMRKTMDSPEYKNRAEMFFPSYKEGSPVQAARVALADLNIVLMDLGLKVLPPVVGALKEFDAVLVKIRSALPASMTGDAKAAGAWGVGKTAAEGALVGAGVGVFASGVGALPGALLGAATGAGAAAVHDSVFGGAVDKSKEGGRAYERPSEYERRIEEMWKPRLRLDEGSATAPKVTTSPIALSLNIDGRTLAETIGTMLTKFGEFPTQAPAADGMGQHYSGDHNWPDK